MPQVSRRYKYRTQNVMNFIAFIILLLTRLFFIGILIVISLFAFLIGCKIVNATKKLIVWLSIGKIESIELFPHYQTYRKVYQHVGYSIDYRWNSVRDYYRAQEIPNGYMRKVKICFFNGTSLSLKLKEDSMLYRKIIKRTK